MDTLTLARSFASLLLDTAAKGTVLLLLACLAAWLCRRSSAALRHSIWCMTMGGLLVLPVASWALPAWQIPILPPEPLPAPVAEAVRLPTPPVAEVVRLPAGMPEGAAGEGFDSPVLRHSTTGPTALGRDKLKDTGGPERPPVAPTVAERVSAPVPEIVQPSPSLTTIEWTSLLVSAGWLLGVSLFGVLLLVGLWRTVKLRRTSLTVADGEWPGMLVELRQRLGLSRAVELREHAESVVPLTWGIWRPVVLLPKLARKWDEPMRRAVLLHELAHVQRGDVACQVLGRLTCVLYWFHPLAWFALRQLRQEREQACDDAVVGTGEKASDYAEQLLQVARLCCAPRGLSLGVAMAEGSSLETRVKSLFDSARSHGPLTRRVAISLFVIGGAILAGLAPIEPTAAEPVEVVSTLQRAFEATVDIHTTKDPNEISGLLGGGTKVNGMGTGIIVDSEGFIVTANHVVSGAKTIRVTLHDGTELPGTVVGTDPVADLAVVRIHALQPLTIMPEQHQSALKVAEEVTAIGNAFGWKHTVSRGIISGLGRDLELSEEQKYTNLIQTDMALNPGSSGGPLLNAQGEAIGINIAIRAGAQKIGFAIPIQDARKVFVGLMSPIISGPAAKEQMDLLKPVFGEAKRGIQLGLAVGSLERTFPQGGRIPLWLFYRNGGEQELTFNTHHDFIAYPPGVKNERGETVQVSSIMHFRFIPPTTITLKPGEVWCIATAGLNLGDRVPGMKPVAGKYKVGFGMGIWDVNTTQRLNTDIPILPSGTPDISGLLKADPKPPAANNLAGQIVETPNWSESLTTGEIEFEIASGENGQLEARVLAAEKHAADADTEAQAGKRTQSQSAVAQPKVLELLSRYRESRKRLEPLHVQMRHIEEYTDAFRAHHRIQAERQELVVKAIQKMSTEDFKKANPHLGPGISADYVRLSIKDSYNTNRSFATMQNQSVSDVELFQKGAAYQIRTRNVSLDDSPGPMSFPAEPLTSGNLGTSYKGIGFYSWAPQTTPPGVIVYGSQPEYRQITSKPYHTNGARPVPAFSNFVSTSSHDWHPIDAFFFQPPENYRVIGAETIDGRETVIVEVPVATSYSQGFANEKGESYQLKAVHYHRAWLDPARGSLPVKLLIWHGNEKTDFATHVSQPPRNVMTTQQLTEVVPGGWYPTQTTLDKYDRDEEKMPKAPPSGQGAEWERYLEDVAKVPLVVYQRETWKCVLVEVPRKLTDEFFVLPTPAGAKIIDRDREDLIDDYSFGLPVNEFSEVGAFLGKAWLLGPLSLMPPPAEQHPTDSNNESLLMANSPKPSARRQVDFNQIVWMDPVDGLQPGFCLLSTGEPLNQRVPDESLIRYRVAVRNTSNAEVTLLLRMRQFEGQEPPYLIPSDEIAPALDLPEIPKQFLSKGQVNPFTGEEPSYVVQLAAGETVIVPSGYPLWIGKDEASARKSHSPRIEVARPGMHWVVQPCRVQKLREVQVAPPQANSTALSLEVIAADGKPRSVQGFVVGDVPTGKPLYARIQLEVGTLNAAAHRNAEKATWGQIEQGMQCGLRILNPQPSYKIGDTLEGEVLWRNTSQAVITTTLPRQLDLYPSIDDSQGQHRLIKFGARFELLPPTHDYQPEEVRSLGVVKVTLVAEGTPGPKTNQEPGQITLEPGQYKLKASGGVGNISPWSGSVEFTVTRAPAAVPEVTTTQVTITGQVVNDKKEPLAGAEVALILEEDNDSTQKGRVAVQTTTDDEGRYVLTLPPEVVTSKRFGAVWARAKGHTLARGHWSSVIPALSNRKDQLTLTATTGTRVQVLDQAGKPLEGVRVRVGRVGIPEGVGYEPPTGWEDHLSATTDSHGEATLAVVIPEAVRELSLQPPKQEAELQFGRNYFLNVRPRSEGRHFSYRLPETGSVEGQLNVAKGHRLPEGLTLEVRSCSLELPQFDGVVRVPVAADGTFRIEQISTGQLIVPPFLAEEQPLRAVVPPHVEVQAGRTARLEVSVAPGVRVQGRVIRSDLKTGFVKYPVTVIYGQSITNRRVDFDRQKFELTTNDEGVFTCVVPPGPIEVQAATHMDGYQRTSSWLPEGKRGVWGGTRFVVPKRESFELEPIELTKSVPIQGKLIDQNKAVVEGWNVYGYPEVPGFEPSSTMNSFAGVHTMKDGHFEGTYPQSYPPVRWKASHRVWKTKYEFDDIKYRAEVVQKSPLILQVDTTKPLED